MCRACRRTEPAAVTHHPTRPISLISVVGALLGPQLFLQAALGLLHPRATRRGNRPGLQFTLRIQATLGAIQPLAPPVGGRKLGRQFVTAAITELLILNGVDLACVAQDLLGELLVVARRALRRVGVQLRAVDGENLDARQAGVGAQRQHFTEQRGERRLVALTKPCDRAVIRDPVGSDHAKGDVLDAAALDHA